VLLDSLSVQRELASAVNGINIRMQTAGYGTP
jgi:hypothetical protein